MCVCVYSIVHESSLANGNMNMHLLRHYFLKIVDVEIVFPRPKNPPVGGMWKGVLETTGRVGFFDPTCAILFYETEHLPKTRLTRRCKNSKRHCRLH